MSEDKETEALLMIEAWLDEHGWDELGTAKFDEWLASAGIDRNGLTIFRCRQEDMLP